MSWTTSLFDGVTTTPVQVVDPEGHEIDYEMHVESSVDGSSMHVYGDLKPNPKTWDLKVRVAAVDFQGLVAAIEALYRAAAAATEIQLTDGVTTYTRPLGGFVSMEEEDGQALSASSIVMKLTFVPTSAYWSDAGTPVEIGL